MALENLFSGESKNIEYKQAITNDSKKYMKTVVAFANGEGGRIVFGVEDESMRIIGMDKEHIFQSMGQRYSPYYERMPRIWAA